MVLKSLYPVAFQCAEYIITSVGIICRYRNIFQKLDQTCDIDVAYNTYDIKGFKQHTEEGLFSKISQQKYVII